ncbi:MAG: LicD family protein [Clostridia bacterium]|nr:LicD family protein [Clostridia bacterium]
MEKLSLSEIKQIELDILDRFSDYCKQNDIKYFLAYGTLLGAVKYKGFIPWDDDIDVIVPREDYDRFIRSFPAEDALELLCRERHSGYVLPFAKLSDPSTIIKGQIAIKDYEYGVHIDIFPLDGWNDSEAIAQKDRHKIRVASRALGMAVSKFNPGRTLLRSVVKRVWIGLAHLKGYKNAQAKMDKEIRSALKNAGKKHSGCVVWPIHGKGEVLPADVFDDAVSVEFEGRVLPAPAGYEKYLHSIYGDFEKELPKDQQVSHHRVKAYKIK